MILRYEWINKFEYSVESMKSVVLCGRNNMNTKENLGKVMDSIKVIKAELRR